MEKEKGKRGNENKPDEEEFDLLLPVLVLIVPVWLPGSFP